MDAPFAIETPRTLSEAIELLAGGGDRVRPIAGGTGLAPLIRYGFFEPVTLVSLRRLRDELATIQGADDGSVRLGALNTLRDLENARLLEERAPILGMALHRLASVRVRNVAQLGGAIAHGHPQMDLPPALLAMDARVRVASRNGQREIAADELFRGYYETAVADDELITEVVVPSAGRHRAAFRKLTARTFDDWPLISLAVVARRGGAGAVEDVRIAIGAVSDRPVRLSAAEGTLVGTDPDVSGIAEVATEAAATVGCRDTDGVSAAYLEHLVAVELRRALRSVLSDAGGGDGTAREGRGR